jgi:hypothetical protein
MKDTRTAQQNKEWWLARADEYSREANKARNLSNKAIWQQRAAEAMAKAESYTL